MPPVRRLRPPGLQLGPGAAQGRLLGDRTGNGYKSQTYELKDAKAAPGFEFLKDAPAHVLQQALRDLDDAYDRFFKGQNRFPRPRKRGENDSFRYPDPKPAQIGVHDPARRGQVRLPKLGWVSVRNCWPALAERGLLFEGELKSVTVKRRADGWYASFNVVVEVPDPVAPTGGPVGVDLGVANSLATSDGELHSLPGVTPRERARTALLQARVARRPLRRDEQGRFLSAKNRDKAKARLARHQARLARRKHDALHKLTTRLAAEHPLVAHEDLRVKNMTASARGTVEQPGRNVAQKAGLNRAILDQCWSEARRQLGYKCQWRGGEAVAVRAAYSSQECSECHHVSPDSRESQAAFRCVACGHESHADVNAARVVRGRGVDLVAGREAAAEADAAAAAAATTDAAATGGPPGSGARRKPGPNARVGRKPPRKSQPRGTGTQLRPEG